MVCVLIQRAYNFNAIDSQMSRPERITIEATGDNFNWYFRYPGDDGVLGNNDDHFSKRHLFLPPNSDVQLKLKSKDYLYSFSLPELSLEEIAVPGLEHEINFKTAIQTTFTLLGDQFCGYAHESLIGEVHISHTDDDFYNWENDTSYAPGDLSADNQVVDETENNEFLQWDNADFYTVDKKVSEDHK